MYPLEFRDRKRANTLAEWESPKQRDASRSLNREGASCCCGVSSRLSCFQYIPFPSVLPKN